MEKPLVQIYQSLQKLVGLHRQLLESVRLERETLVQADLSGIQCATLAKQSLIQEIHHAEGVRLKQSGELALFWKKPLRELTLPNIIMTIQGEDARGAEQFRSMYNTLNVLIQRITDQNQSNLVLIEKSLEHVHQMKKNILNEAAPQSTTYSQQGQRVSSAHHSRLISKEV